MPWFRMYAEFAFDLEVQSLAFDDQRHFVMALCLKCSGILDKPRPRDELLRIVKRALGLDAMAFDEATKRLVAAGLIDDDWQPRNWKKRQYLSDTSTDRVRRHRRRKEKSARNGHETFPVTGTDTDTDSEADTDEPPNPLASKGAAAADPLLEPFASSDPLRDTPRSVETKTEERRVGREHLKRTRVAAEDKPDPPYAEIGDLYTKICVPHGFLAIKYLTPQRKREIHNRWYEVPKRQEIDWWRKFFEYVVKCDGLKGKDWANFGFLVSDKMVDITEGKYERAFTR